MSPHFHPGQGLSRKEYEQKKEVVANEIIRRLEKKFFKIQ
jgi:prolycopene isomerase